MRRGLLICGLVLAMAATGAAQQMDTVAGTLAPKLATAARKNVAVVDFTDLQGTPTELGRYLAEELSVALAATSKGFTVIDRTHLKAILQENKLGANGIIDPATARQLGRIAGVDALITGTLTPFGDSVRLSVKVLDTQTVGILAATSADVPKTKAVEELLSRSVGASPMSSAAANAATAPMPVGGMRMSVLGIDLVLTKCGGRGRVVCEFAVLSPSADVVLLIRSTQWTKETRAIGTSSEEYSSGSMQIGKNQDSYQVRNTLVAGVPFEAKVAFESVSESETGFAVLDINISVDARHGGGDKTIRFRNVPIVK